MEKEKRAKKSIDRINKVRNDGRNALSGRNGGDMLIMLLTCALCLFGIVMVYSASYYMSINENDGDPHYYLFRQSVFAVTGFVIMIVLANVDYHILTRAWSVFYLAGLLLLILVLVAGSTAYGGQRWLVVGPITIMPGEIAKMAIIITITGYLSRQPSLADDWKKGIIPILAMSGIYAVMIMKQPNMTTAFTLVFVVAVMLFIAGTGIGKIVLLGILGVATAVASVFSSEYRMARFRSMLDPFSDPLNEGYQAVQSLLALGKGGLTGAGLGNSVQKDLYLPFCHNDFILSIIGEELGFIGILVLMIFYVFLIWRGLHIALNAADYDGMLLASGIVTMIGIQVIMHIAVVTSIMPPTGVVLPFISYGGNAMWIFMGSIGILMNISKNR